MAQSTNQWAEVRAHMPETDDEREGVLDVTALLLVENVVNWIFKIKQSKRLLVSTKSHSSVELEVC